MKTAALISEFNPFHLGHKFCIDSIRAKLGDDTCIIAIMSGNYTQRGDVAVSDKFSRAAAAVEGGIDLVLEIPFPFSVSSAEFYATAGVRMAAALGIVDTLAFGSECGDISALSELAANLSTDAFKTAFERAVKAEEHKGHALLTEEVYERLFGNGAALLRSPNNVLAVEYLRANAALSTPLSVLTVKRQGEYHDASLTETVSATAVRASLTEDPAAAYAAMPEGSARILAKAVKDGRAPATLSGLGNVFLSYFRTAAVRKNDDLSHRMRDAAIKAADLSEFCALVATKRYTHAHIRRAMWHRYFGITSADLRETPAYTQILGMNARGRALLRRAAKEARLTLLTKPADAHALSGVAARQAALSQKADLLYPLAMPRPTAGNAAMLAAPYIAP